MSDLRDKADDVMNDAENKLHELKGRAKEKKEQHEDSQDDTF